MKDLCGGLQWLLHETVEHAGVGRCVHYVHAGEETLLPWSGEATHSTSSDDVWGLFDSSRSVEELRDGVLTRIDQMTFIASADHLSSVPTRRDRIVDGTVSYAVIGWELDPTGAFYHVFLRRLG